MANFLSKLFDSNRQTLNRYSRNVEKINGLADEMESLSDEDLQAKTEEFKRRYEQGETLDDLLVEAFAVVREAAKRVLGLYPFEVQLMGGMALHEGNIAEMKTGEGKTLTATLPVYLNALAGKGVHVVTVNDYLAKRDSEEMGELYRWLGLTVGLNLPQISSAEKQAAYAADITYSTNNELGFDYLRDNMAVYEHQQVQRGLNFALVDEVDSILIDEARTPLIISGAAQSSTAQYNLADFFVKGLENNKHYRVDVQSKTVSLTEEGIEAAEDHFNLDNLYDLENQTLLHHIDQSLRANYIMERDVDYVVREDEVLIVDGFTGRIMDGRRYSDGLHQAIEAKESVPIQDESKTMATITFQNFFRMYDKLSGMTGTGKTEEEEFQEIYDMDVIQIPTNEPVIREDYPDLIFPTMQAKFDGVVATIKEKYEIGQPVLVGTVAVETSEYLSHRLNQEGIPHQVLNAKYHEKEADIIQKAGQRGAVTIATNMAGRGTDIKLGPGVREVGGLAVIGTERHESRRIDDQLRGRSGRQGDPGESQFFLSLEDDLMRRFGSEAVQRLLEVFDMEDDDIVMDYKGLSRQVENAQRNVEGNNYDSRRNVLKYDDVMREQREVIYSQRQQVIKEDESLKYVIQPMIERTIRGTVRAHTIGEPSEWNLEAILDFAQTSLVHPESISMSDLKGKSADEISDYLIQLAKDVYEEKEEALPNEGQMLEYEKVILLRVVDTQWTDHIDEMDQLRQGIGLRSYGQDNPLNVYQQEGFRMFEEMVDDIDFEVTRLFLKSQIRQNLQREQVGEGKATKASASGMQSRRRRQRQVQPQAGGGQVPQGRMNRKARRRMANRQETSE